MKIGEVAKQLDMPPSTIRYYERKGLIAPPMRVSGKREFGTNTVVTLRFIQLCQAAGFTIDEILSLLERYGNSSSDGGIWESAVETKRIQIRKQLDELKQMDEILCELEKCRCGTIEHCVSEAILDSRWTHGENE